MGRLNHERPQFKIADSAKRSDAADLAKVLRPVAPGKIAGNPLSLFRYPDVVVRLKKPDVTEAEKQSLKRKRSTVKAPKIKRSRVSAADASKKRQEALGKAAANRVRRGKLHELHGLELAAVVFAKR